MPKIVKLNYDRKVRYLYDKDTEECSRLAEQIMDHYGQFLETPHGWDMDDIAVYEKLLRNCGLSVNEFLAKTFEITPPKVKKKPTVKKKTPVKKPTVKQKTPVKKPTTTRKKSFSPVTKKKTPVKKRPTKK
jgi:hypothetical protein